MRTWPPPPIDGGNGRSAAAGSLSRTGWTRDRPQDRSGSRSDNRDFLIGPIIYTETMDDAPLARRVPRDFDAVHPLVWAVSGMGSNPVLTSIWRRTWQR